MGYTLTGKGLQRTQRVEVKVGQSVYFGASGSPDLVEVVSVDAQWITVDRRGAQVREQRWIAEDLIARGMSTMRRRAHDMLDWAQDAGSVMAPLYRQQAQAILEIVRA